VLYKLYTSVRVSVCACACVCVLAGTYHSAEPSPGWIPGGTEWEGRGSRSPGFLTMRHWTGSGNLGQDTHTRARTRTYTQKHHDSQTSGKQHPIFQSNGLIDKLLTKTKIYKSTPAEPFAKQKQHKHCSLSGTSRLIQITSRIGCDNYSFTPTIHDVVFRLQHPLGFGLQHYFCLDWNQHFWINWLFCGRLSFKTTGMCTECILNILSWTT
jgi:hypothetical protein